MFNLKNAILTAVFATVVSGVSWFCSDFVQAKQDQIINWADKTYLKISTFDHRTTRSEIRQVKRDIFDLLRVKEQRPLTDLEAKRLHDLQNEMHDLENDLKTM